MSFAFSTWPLARAWFLCIALVLLAAPASVHAAPRDRTAPTTPTNLRTTAGGVGSYSVSLVWNASTDASPFSYYVAMIDGYASRTAIVPQSQTSYTWRTDLNPGRTYTFYVWALDVAGNRSGNTNLRTLTLPADATAPTAPVVSQQSIGSGYVSLSWTGAMDDGPAAAVRFRVFRDGALVVDNWDQRGFTQTGLAAGATYTYTVQARDLYGNWSALSNALTVTTPVGNAGDVTPPTTPTNVYADVFGDGEFSLTWAQSTDNVTPQSRIVYRVYVDGVFSDSQIGRGGPSVNYVNGEQSSVTVIAVDEVGNQSAPATIIVRR